MSAGYANLRKQRTRQQRKVGREEEGSSSNRPELAAFVLALRGTSVKKLVLYLCDNEPLLKAVKRWVGKGGKAAATLAGAPDADISREAIEELRKRATAEAAKCLSNLKWKRIKKNLQMKKPTSKQTSQAISSNDVPMESRDRTNRAVFIWQEPRWKGD